MLVSGAGTNLQALIDASGDPAYGARIVAVGADREGIGRAAGAGERGAQRWMGVDHAIGESVEERVADQLHEAREDDDVGVEGRDRPGERDVPLRA